MKKNKNQKNLKKLSLPISECQHSNTGNWEGEWCIITRRARESVYCSDVTMSLCVIPYYYDSTITNKKV